MTTFRWKMKKMFAPDQLIDRTLGWTMYNQFWAMTRLIDELIEASKDTHDTSDIKKINETLKDTLSKIDSQKMTVREMDELNSIHEKIHAARDKIR